MEHMWYFIDVVCIETDPLVFVALFGWLTRWFARWIDRSTADRFLSSYPHVETGRQWGEVAGDWWSRHEGILRIIECSCGPEHPNDLQFASF